MKKIFFEFHWFSVNPLNYESIDWLIIKIELNLFLVSSLFSGPLEQNCWDLWQKSVYYVVIDLLIRLWRIMKLIFSRFLMSWDKRLFSFFGWLFNIWRSLSMTWLHHQSCEWSSGLNSTHIRCLADVVFVLLDPLLLSL